MFVEHERFKNVASGFQSVAVVIAIAVGGVWALYTFKALRMANRAQADIAKAQAEITEIERRIVEQPVLEMELQINPVATTGRNAYLLKIHAKFRNDGKRIVKVAFQDSTLLVSKLNVDQSGTKVDGQVRKASPIVLSEDGRLEQVAERVLRPNQSREVGFVVPISGPGIYLVQLRLVYSGLELQNGELVQSSDEPIDAFTQKVVQGPSETNLSHDLQ